MSANHSAEVAAIAAIAPRPAADIKLREAITEQIASLVVRQFHVALLRAAAGSPTAEHFVPSIERNGEVARAGVDEAEVMRLRDKLPAEVTLWLRVICQALHDELCGKEKVGGGTQALRDEAHRYFWSQHRHCLVRHCLLIGLQPSYVRELAGKAADFVDEQARAAFARARAGDRRLGSRADRLRQLIGEAGGDGS